LRIADSFVFDIFIRIDLFSYWYYSPSPSTPSPYWYYTQKWIAKETIASRM